MSSSPLNVAVLIYDGVELVDMNGPVDVFYHASLFTNNRYNIFTIAETPDAVGSEGGIVTIVPKYAFTSEHPTPDIVIIPGQLNANGVPIVASDAVVNWIKTVAGNNATILAVCVGIYHVAKSGLLNGKKATTHYMAINQFHIDYPEIQIIKNVRYVEDGQFVTTAGISSGIDGALYLIEKNDGADMAQQVADLMIYNRAAPLPPYTILPPYYPAG
ncbi:DJ-1/PfpI family protein [Filimonas lacunae]|uniref:DJ-1/PfpI family protein n=1 Tax=Filimonas lacunae TaxID=477680 RepID=A0A173MGK1_9BACT|nr:DJ-1/PfpI family protein [Filimonas lacunae]BAV06610.1 transcriptional regulator, AraC family [Filimonas lacunae]SIT27574.1 DJ-1/PfpI family protein [Filimonas lacunae]